MTWDKHTRKFVYTEVTSDRSIAPLLVLFLIDLIMLAIVLYISNGVLGFILVFLTIIINLIFLGYYFKPKWSLDEEE